MFPECLPKDNCFAVDTIGLQNRTKILVMLLYQYPESVSIDRQDHMQDDEPHNPAP